MPLRNSVTSLFWPCFMLALLVAAASSGGCRSSSSLLGTWQSEKNQDFQLTLEFKPDNKAILTISEPGKKSEPPTDGVYAVDGNTVTVNAGFLPLVLTRNGNNLIGALMGIPLKMTKK